MKPKIGNSLWFTLKPESYVPSRLYGQHKPTVPLKSVIDFTNSSTYNLSKYLVSVLQKDTQNIVKDLYDFKSQMEHREIDKEDIMTGCRILTGLLVHSDAVHFTASICPSCSVSLISPRRSVPHCSAGHLYHRLAELRLSLEETVSSVSNGHCDSASSLNSYNGQSRYTCFSDWLIDLDNFLSDAAKETEVSTVMKCI
ncbi:unnamed protein product [Trichobilharzia regenti]|nr:unnamed protein product [Trichobilharzia regenti]